MSNVPDDWADIAWYKLTPGQRERAVDILRSAPGWEEFAEVARQGHAQHGSEFIHKPPLSETITVPGPGGDRREVIMPWHFSGGMRVRNLLREKGFVDAYLPKLPEVYGGEAVSSWDDFYVQAIEAAIGVRPVDFQYIAGKRLPVYAGERRLPWRERARTWLTDFGNAVRA